MINRLYIHILYGTQHTECVEKKSHTNNIDAYKDAIQTIKICLNLGKIKGNVAKTNSCIGIKYNANLSATVVDKKSNGIQANDIIEIQTHNFFSDSVLNMNLFLKIKNKIAGTTFNATRIPAPSDVIV